MKGFFVGLAVANLVVMIIALATGYGQWWWGAIGLFFCLLQVMGED